MRFLHETDFKGEDVDERIFELNRVGISPLKWLLRAIEDSDEQGDMNCLPSLCNAANLIIWDIELFMEKWAGEPKAT